MTTNFSPAVVYCALAATFLGVVGCQTESGHQKNLQAANDRWKSLRASLVLPMAQKQFNTGDLDQAERTLADAISIDPKNPQLLVLAGRVALERGQLERSFQRLHNAIESDPKMPEAYYFQGLVLQRWKRYDPAMERYNKAYELEPDNVAYLLAVSEMLVAMDRPDEALKLLSDKATYFDQSSAIRVGIGELYSVTGQYSKAAEYFQQAILLDPDDLQILEELALAQLNSGLTAQSVSNLEQLCSQPSYHDRPDLSRALARGYTTLGRPSDAKAIYLKLTYSNPKDEQSWIGLGEVCWAVNDTAGALVAANRVMALNPNRHEGYLLAGMVWHKRGDIDRALSMFDLAAEHAPKSAVPMILRGITLEQANRVDEAAKAYAEALRRNPNSTQAQRLLAQLE